MFSLYHSNSQILSQLQYYALKRATSDTEALPYYIISYSSVSESAEYLAKMQSDEWGSEYDYC